MRTKNGTFAIIMVTLFVLWKSEISEFALSVTAIAGCDSRGFKGIILCLLALFNVRVLAHFNWWLDWSREDQAAKVIGHNLMATVIQEIDLYHGQYHFTGRPPRCLIACSSLIGKEPQLHERYVYHNFLLVTVKLCKPIPNDPGSHRENWRALWRVYRCCRVVW